MLKIQNIMWWYKEYLRTHLTDFVSKPHSHTFPPSPVTSFLPSSLSLFLSSNPLHLGGLGYKIHQTLFIEQGVVPLSPIWYPILFPSTHNGNNDYVVSVLPSILCRIHLYMFRISVLKTIMHRINCTNILQLAFNLSTLYFWDIFHSNID